MTIPLGGPATLGIIVLMDIHSWITILTIILAAILMITERMRPDLVGLLVILVLSGARVISPADAFSGFSQSAVMTILSVFIISEALQRSGVTRWIGQRLIRLAGPSRNRLTAAIALTAAGLSTFMKPIASAAALLPSVVGLARQTRLRPSHLLMPLSFGALLGGTATLLTTANIIVSATLEVAGYEPFGLLDFLPVGIPLVLTGTLAIVILAPRILPSRDVAGQFVRMQRMQNELVQSYGLSDRLLKIRIMPGSPLDGVALHEFAWGKTLGSEIMGISRRHHFLLAPDRNTCLRIYDILLLDSEPNVREKEKYCLEAVEQVGLESGFGTEGMPLIEVAIVPHSDLGGRTLRQLDFRQRFGMQVLAIWRNSQILPGPVADITLQIGDALLMQGPRSNVEKVNQDPNFIILEEETDARPQPRAWVAVGILAISLGLGAIGVLPVGVATLMGATLMVLSGTLDMDEAYQAVDWRTIFLVAGMLPLTIALNNTGLAASIGNGLMTATAGLGPLPIAGFLLVATIVISTFLGGQTAGIIVAPIAIAAAQAGGSDPRAMAMAVAIGCSLAFISPLGHPAHLLVMGPGGYTFRDYFRLGAPITLLMVLVTLAGLHWIWHI